MRSPKRARKRPTVCGVRAISGNEHDRSAPAFERNRAGLQVDLGLAAPGCAVEEEVGALPGVECADDAVESRTLRGAELGRLCLTRQRVALCRLRPLAAGLPLDGRDQRERASRRGAVVLRDPESELDEGLRQFLDDTFDLRRVDAFRRRDVDLRHDTSPLRVAEAHLDDRARLNLVPDLVRELARERARRYEWIDRGIASHPASLESATRR